jgi:para-nitrobenzyl esterase
MPPSRWKLGPFRLLTLLALGALPAGAPKCAEPLMPLGPVVKTATGSVIGATERGILVFRGIRFAAPPVGSLRFRPPVPPSPWTGVAPALDFAPACPQLVEIDPTENNNSVMAEDCLAVNVWTPRTDQTKRPVMVWIHGGGFISGSARNTWYDGAALAARGNVVVVTLQYRLGAWGFLDLSKLGGKDYAESGNLGLLDQIAALEWVRRNIGSFGGDPDNVTLFGQSAGAGSVGMLMTVPAAWGLFQKAILESGTPKEVNESGRAIEVAEAFMKLAGASNLEELRTLKMTQLRDAQQRLLEQMGSSAFRPVVDGRVLKEPPMRAIAAGRASYVPLLLGTNADEIRLWSGAYDLPIDQEPLDIFETRLTAIVGERAHQAVKIYRANEADDGDTVVHLIQDLLMRMPAIRLAEMNGRHAPTYMYEFTYRSTSTYKKFESAHGMEVPFVFGTAENPEVIVFTGRSPVKGALTEQVQQVWSDFARTGDPGNSRVSWPKYEETARETMRLGASRALVGDPGAEQRKVWEGLAFDGMTPNSGKIWQLVYSSIEH